MSRLTVVVDRDDTGKLWNYVFLQDELSRASKPLATSAIIVHRSEPSSEKTNTSEKPASMRDYITIGALPPREKMRKKVSKQNF